MRRDGLWEAMKYSVKGTDDIRIVDRAESWQGPVQVRVS